MARGSNQISKEEKQREKVTMKITKFLRFNVPKKQHKINKEEMECFNGEDALKTLMESKFFVKDGTSIPRAEREVGKFYTREDCINFWRVIVANRMALRGMKLYKDDKDKKIVTTTDCCGQKTSTVVDKSDKEKDKDGEKAEDDKAGSTDAEKKEEPEKKRRKFKVAMHQRQGFLPEQEEIYIWRYNPTPWQHWIYGAGVLLVVIGGTLFPLWPDQLRTGVYYGSVGLASFIGGILVVGFLRTILFGVIWACTRGKHHLWILPNLLEDVGFFDSFKPGYTWVVKEDKKKPAIEEKSSSETPVEAVEDSESKKDK